MWDRSLRNGVRVLTSNTLISPERSEAAIKRPSQRKEAEETTSEKEEIVEEGESVCGLKRVSEVE